MKSSGPTQHEASGGKARFIVLGGFLGAGKTSAIIKLGELLRAKGKGANIGVITNDEGNELVDTAQLRDCGFAVEEIAGGSFGNRLESFLGAANRLAREKRCDVILAEPAGGSANLRSAVLNPLREKSGGTISLAPLSVLVDVVRAARVLRLEAGGMFSDKLNYIYRKQIEEAQFLVISKSDLVSAPALTKLQKALGELAPEATIFAVSTRTGAGIEEWFNALMKEEYSPGSATALDAQLHSDGEALLGWLNCTVRVSSVKYFDGAKLLIDLATFIQSALQQEGVEVAHLKIMLRQARDSSDSRDTATIHLVRNDLAPELTGEIREPVQRVELILNLRAEAKPDLLHSAANRALLEIMERAPNLFARMEHCEHFRANRSTAGPLTT